MKIILSIGAVLAFLSGCGVWAVGTSAIHEILAAILFLNAAVCFSAVCIIEALEKIRRLWDSTK